MKQFFCGLGSNLGNPVQKVSIALEKIKALKGIFSFQASSLYQTSPVSTLPQPCFINAVCGFKTSLTPKEIFEKTQEIEIELGKVPKSKEAPRPIDIDLLYVEGYFSNDLNLILPHPCLLDRLFVLKPLLELTPFLELPKSLYAPKKLSLELQVSYLEKISLESAQALKP